MTSIRSSPSSSKNERPSRRVRGVGDGRLFRVRSHRLPARDRNVTPSHEVSGRFGRHRRGTGQMLALGPNQSEA